MAPGRAGPPGAGGPRPGLAGEEEGGPVAANSEGATGLGHALAEGVGGQARVSFSAFLLRSAGPAGIVGGFGDDAGILPPIRGAEERAATSPSLPGRPRRRCRARRRNRSPPPLP